MSKVPDFPADEGRRVVEECVKKVLYDGCRGKVIDSERSKLGPHRFKPFLVLLREGESYILFGALRRALTHSYSRGRVRAGVPG